VAKAIGAAMGRPSFFPTPGFMLRLGLGEVSQLVLGSQKVLPKKALALGYKFKQPEVAAALREILAKR
jgi:NAD dependent epimerase/dehydratase family enzyme